GARTYYPNHDKDVSIGEILASFLAQFYVGKIAPPSLLLSHPPDDAALLTEAFSQHAGYKVTISVPQLGDKKRLIDHARKNAE
ncbi:hypothetical protein ACSLVO_29565, partial [Klebsiella pneumoniae]